MIRRLAVAFAFIVLAAGSLAEEEAPRQVLLRHRFAAGQTVKYRGRVEGKGTITMMGEPQAVKIEGQFDLTQKVLHVAEDGAARIVTTVQGGWLVFRTPVVSQRLPISLPPLIQVMTPEGRLLKSPGWRGGATQTSRAHINLRRVIERIHLLHFPADPVAVGHSWVHTPRPPTAPAGKVESETAPRQPERPPAGRPVVPPAPTWKLTFTGLQRVAGRECARIRATAKSPIKDMLPPGRMGDIIELDGSEHLETTTDFALAAGRVMRQVASAHTKVHTLTYRAAGGQPIAGETDITAKVTLELPGSGPREGGPSGSLFEGR